MNQSVIEAVFYASIGAGYLAMAIYTILRP